MTADYTTAQPCRKCKGAEYEPFAQRGAGTQARCVGCDVFMFWIELPSRGKKK